jgi:hypothetical protein
MSTPIARETADSPDRVTALLGLLIDEDNRLAVGGRLEWIEYARRQLRQLGAPPAPPAGGEAR